MKKIVFVCHGNICRSPMAEFVLKQLAAQRGVSDQLLIESRATISDEIGAGGLGHPMDVRAERQLTKEHVPYTKHQAQLLVQSDYQKYDLLICMDEENFLDMNRITAGDPERKEHKLLEYAGKYRDIDDPWYTNDFQTAFDDIKSGCEGLVRELFDNAE